MAEFIVTFSLILTSAIASAWLIWVTMKRWTIKEVEFAKKWEPTLPFAPKLLHFNEKELLPLWQTDRIREFVLTPTNGLARLEEQLTDTANDPTMSLGAQHDLLTRVRMIAKNDRVVIDSSQSDQVPAQNSSNPTRLPVNRRTPSPSGYLADPENTIAVALNKLVGLPDSGGRYSIDDSPHAEIQRLRIEATELRKLLSEMKHLLQEASDTEQQMVAKEKEFDMVLAAKDRQIEILRAQLGVTG